MGILRFGSNGGSQPPGGPVYPGTPMHPAGVPPPGPPPRRWGRRGAQWLVLATALFGVVALCCMGALSVVVVSLPGGYSEPDAAPPSDPGREPTGSPGPGTPVRDGHLTFVVDRVDCGAHSLGRPPDVRTTAGQFCLVHLSIINADERPVGFSEADQRAFSSEGREYGPDSAASALVNRGVDLRQVEVGPGRQVAGAIVFNVPPGAQLSRVRLHESPGSPGAEVVIR